MFPIAIKKPWCARRDVSKLTRLISRRIVILLVLLFCAGCVHNLLSLGGKKETAPGLSPPKDTVLNAPNTAVAPSPALSPEKRPRIVATAAGSDFSYHNEIMTEDVTWRGTVFVMGGLTIAPQATLTVDAGTVVTVIPDDEGSSGGSILVQGRLAVHGTAEKPVRFKPGTEKTLAGDWQGILFLGSGKNNILEQCRVEGAATGLDAVFSTVSLKGSFFVSCGTGARFQGSLVRVTGGGASGCELGCSLVDSETDMREAVFSGNSRGLLLSGGALYITSSDFSSNTARALESKGSKLMVLRSVFSGNGSGLSLSSSDGALEANRMVDNMEYGVRLTRSRMRLSGNLISRNAGVGIMADDGDAAAWGNDISSNGQYDLYNAGREDFRAAGNWWGAPSVAQVKKRIFDKDDDPQRGAVLLQPLLSAIPPQSP
jgi:hypothetical protein